MTTKLTKRLRQNTTIWRGDGVIVTRGNNHLGQFGVLRDCNPYSMRWFIQLGAGGPFVHYRAGSFRPATRAEIGAKGVNATCALERSLRGFEPCVGPWLSGYTSREYRDADESQQK